MITPNTKKSILVLGLGRSGAAAARLALSQGHSVTIIDCDLSTGLDQLSRDLSSEGARVELNADSIPPRHFDLCVTSPGVPDDSPWLKHARQQGILVISELEWGWGHVQKPVLAVTGSNGKSTLVKLCCESLSLAGIRSVPSGNYGMPLSEAVLRHSDSDWFVVECSSFQLEHIVSFRPRVAVLLNIHPNHLDRHQSMDDYRALKYRIFQNMISGDIRILNDELERIPADAPFRTFSAGKGGDYRFVPAEHQVQRPEGRPVPLLGTLFDNSILGLTAAAAVAALDACGGYGDLVADAARSFRRLPHRLNQVEQINNVRFVDDSKATNLAAMTAALNALEGPIRLIAGGKLKENTLDSVKEVLAKRAEAVYLIGESMEALAHAWGDSVSCQQCSTLDEAVKAAWRDAEPGDSILLSPACASFDQFSGYEDRGRAFARIIEGLKKET